MKKTSIADRFVVYDSGYFENDSIDRLLNKYVLKENTAKHVSQILSETFALMKHWLPEAVGLSKSETRFRIIKNFFSIDTGTKTQRSKIFVADIVDSK